MLSSEVACFGGDKQDTEILRPLACSSMKIPIPSFSQIGFEGLEFLLCENHKKFSVFSFFFLLFVMIIQHRVS